ncbi:MAG: pyrimidine dimer DNA glycosylase/endonuclease V [Sulfurimicrobium sp.]
MRLWTLHPRYLDRQGLLALWREGLLAQKVLLGLTRGYRHHPQLTRFRACDAPSAAISAYLREVHAEACRRGYRFESSKIASSPPATRIVATTGQLDFERQHLRRKLALRDPARLAELDASGALQAHPLFHITEGGVALWEKVEKE